MKKRFIAIFITIVLAASILVGCGASFSKVKMGNFVQNTDYIVYSNGGNAVQYGDIIYFINGTRGYDVTDGTSTSDNQWGNVVKGALYKAKLEGTKSGREWEISRNAETELELVSHKGNLYEDIVSDEEYTAAELLERETDIVDVELVAPKTIGTSGYASGGIFIYDDYIYYATPHNSKNKSGTVQTNLTDFMRTKIDGSHTQLIFTTEESSADKPYAFYKQGTSVYLVCYYGTKLVSVEMKDGKKKVEKAMLLTDEATSVLFSVRDTYDSKNNETNDPEDFIYFTRAVKDDELNSGNVVVAVRPSGKESVTVLSTGATITLEAVKDGGLFYSFAVGTYVEVKFSNLHTSLMEHIPSYRAAEEQKQSASETDDVNLRKRYDISATVFSGTQNLFNTYTSRYYIRNGMFSNECTMIAFTESEVWVRTSLNKYVTLNMGAEMHFIDNNYLYYNRTGETAVHKTPLFMSVTEKTDADYVQVTQDNVVTSGLKTDIVAGYIVYFARIDEWADAYAYFRKVTVEGGEDIQVYERHSDDEKPEEDDDADEIT